MNTIKIFLLLFLGYFFISCYKTENEPAVNVIKSFDVYGFIPYTGYIKNGTTIKTNYQGLEVYLQTIGVKKVNLIYENRLIDFPTGNLKEGVPNIKNITDLATAALNDPNTLVSLDIEGWNRFSTSTPIKYVEVMDIFKKANKVSKVGFYAIAPQATFSWTADVAAKYDNLNKTYASVAAVVDIFSPTLYNFDGHDNLVWKKSAEYNIDQSKKYGFANKSIIPYITPEVANTGGLKTFLSYDEMFFRLQMLYDLGANGCIIWTSSQTRDANGNPIIFDETSGWGKAIKDFLSSHK